MDANSNKNQCLFTGHVNIVKLLLENDADRNLLNEDGQTALALAEKESNLRNINEKHEQIVDLLKAYH